MRPIVPIALALAAAGLACDQTVYDAVGVPRAGPLVCAEPGTHACVALDACARDDDAERCGPDCRPCATDVPGAKAICVANACGYECPAGRLKCEAGCCGAAVVSAGGDHACAVTEGTGELLCWGANNDGQLGTGDRSGADQPTPVKVPLPARTIAVSAGTAHTCAVVEGGDVHCWGRASSFVGGAEYVYAPQLVPRLGLGGATAVAAGGGHTCALLAGGAVRCAGAWNPGGVAGDVPVAAGATALAAGDDFSCALAGGQVLCWGVNDHGQVGAPDVAQPAVIPLPAPASALALGWHHGCAATAEPGAPVRCWSGPPPELRLGLSSDPATPYRLDAVTWPVSALAAGGAHACAVRDPADEGIDCWGNTGGDVVIGGTAATWGAPVHVAVAGPVTGIGAGDAHTCAVDGAGSVSCWGRGGRGQLGDGARADSAAPVLVVSR